MSFGLRLSSVLLAGMCVSSILIFPEVKNDYTAPTLCALGRLEKNLEVVKQDQKKPLNVWRTFQSMLMEEYATLTYENVPEEELRMLFDKIKTMALPILKSVITHSAKNMQSLSGYEKHLIHSIVKSSLKILEQGSIAYRYMSSLEKKIDKFEKIPYEYMAGNADEVFKEDNLTFFTWNTCMLPGKLSLKTDGISPWRDRIEAIKNKLKNQNCDIVCLQEVHSEFAAAELYDALKDDYAHFYMNMGPKTMGATPSDVGLNSGLFVASKIPLTNPHFEVFISKESGSFVNKGFFYAKPVTFDLGFCTTHLEPNSELQDIEKRAQDLEYVTTFLKAQPEKIRLLTGDLNIAWGSKEKGESLLKAHYFDPYNKHRFHVNMHSRTHTDYFLSKKGKGSSSILDYFLILQSPGFEKFAFISDRVNGYEEGVFNQIASDHHALSSTVICPKKK